MGMGRLGAEAVARLLDEDAQAADARLMAHRPANDLGAQHVREPLSGCRRILRLDVHVLENKGAGRIRHGR